VQSWRAPPTAPGASWLRWQRSDAGDLLA
jgi:hypothetical protein